MIAKVKVISESSPDVDKLIKENSIVEVAREIGVGVGKSTIPCINREKHKNPNGPPSLSFNLIKNTFRCWVCPGVGGTVLDLVIQFKQVSREKAIEFLQIRSEIRSDEERVRFFSHHKPASMDTTSREVIFREFLTGLNQNANIELIAFASTKGGTGKSLVVNNMSVILALITHYIGKHNESDPQIVELIDLDFGKPDQRLLMGVEPDIYLEDIFYLASDDRWGDLRKQTPISNLKMVSACPVRKSNQLYYMKKNEILYMLHNSDALLKLADFGGGSDKDTLDFLSHIKSKIFVINTDKASIEAVFNLILSLIYFPLKLRFKGNKEALALLDEFRHCQKNGTTVNTLREGFEALDKKQAESLEFTKFYKEKFLPFRKQLGFENGRVENPRIEFLKNELIEMRDLVDSIMFIEQSKGKREYQRKAKIYRDLTNIEVMLNSFTTLTSHLDDQLKTRLFGLIINKASRDVADPIAEEFVARVKNTFSHRLTYLGNIPEDKMLRNISNYQIPFVLYDPQNPVLENFYSIADKVIGLKSGSTIRIIHDQLDYIGKLKANWYKADKSPIEQ